MHPFRIKKSVDKQYYFVIVSGNGQVLATSETYLKKQYCKDAINATIRLIFPADVRSLPQSYWILDETKKAKTNKT